MVGLRRRRWAWQREVWLPFHQARPKPAVEGQHFDFAIFDIPSSLTTNQCEQRY